MRLPRTKGQIILIMLVFFALFVGVTAAFVSYLTITARAENLDVAREEAREIAEAGIDKAVDALNQNGSYSGETGTALGNGTFTVSVTSVDSSTKKISVTGDVPNAANPTASRTVTAEVGINTSVVAFNFGVQVGKGGLMMDDNSIVNGNIYSDGDISGDGEVVGDATVAAGSAATPDQEWSTQNGSVNLGDVSARADLAQSFVPSATNTLSSVDLYLKKVGTPSDLAIELVSDNSGQPSKTVLASGTLAASGVTGSYGFIPSSFSSTPTLTAGQTYWIIAAASVNASNYFVWGSDTTDGYPSGTGESSSHWNAHTPSWFALSADLDFETYMGGTITSLSGIHVTGNAWAHELSSCTIDGNATYNSSNSCSVGGATYPGSADAAPVTLPISNAQISDWESVASAGGVIAGPYTVSAPQTLGPTEINGNLAINSALTIAGPIWVNGDVTFGNGSSMTVASTLGNNGTVLVADMPSNTAAEGTISLSQNATFAGNGNVGSYPMLLSTNTGSSAILLSQNANGAIVYASAGTVLVDQNAAANQITGYSLHLRENATVNYVSGLASQSFSNGPGGSWTFLAGTYGLTP